MALGEPPRSHENELPPRLFSRQCLKGNFCELPVEGVLGSPCNPDQTPWESLGQSDWGVLDRQAGPQARAKESGLPSPPSETAASLRAASMRSRRSRSRCSLSLANSASGCSSQVFILNSISSRTARNFSSMES